MTKNPGKYNRDYRYIVVVKERVRNHPNDLLLPRIQKRLREIVKHWTPLSDTISREAAALLNADTSKLRTEIGSTAMVTFRVSGGEIKVLCKVVAKIDRFRRYRVTPVNGHGAVIVNAPSVEFAD